MSRWKAELALGFNAVSWGTTFVLVKDALSSIPPFTFIALRFTLGRTSTARDVDALLEVLPGAVERARAAGLAGVR